jgi:hypothetical protein
LHGRGSGFGGLYGQARSKSRVVLLTPGTWTATVSWPDGRRSLAVDFDVPDEGGAITVELVDDEEP